MTTPSAIGTTLLSALAGVLPEHRPLHLHEPELGDLEQAALSACIDSGFVSSVGAFVDEFEACFAKYTGARHAIAIVNGTAALEVALVLAGVERSDEVIVPALSFVGTANAVIHAGATPHFVDSAEVTLGMDPAALDAYLADIAIPSAHGPVNRVTGARIAAIVPMHTYGHPVDLAPLMTVADAYGIPIVEDAAESLGSTYRGQHTGTFGRLGIFSFNGNKIVTTGGGGMIITDDADLAARARHLTTTAKVPHTWNFEHDEVAWNYRMPNINASLGCAQMQRLPDFLVRKRALADAYCAAFADAHRISFISEPEHSTSNYWLCTIRLHDATESELNEVLAAANSAGFGCRPAWRLLSSLPMYETCPRAPLPIAETLASQLINLPSSPALWSDACE